jgi:hypothetical protein
VALAAILLTSACSYATEEPGLFPLRQPPSAVAPAPTKLPPERTNPSLPVAAEAEWTTGDDVRASLRFAIHSVRRMPGATVLDWSVTPISAPGFRYGDDLPFVDLGLTHSGEGDVNVLLLDSMAGKAYRPLSHRSERQFNRCLCTPLWAIQQGLRIGETRLLQTAFPALPDALTQIDVDLVNLAPFSHIAVTPVGEVPTALGPTDLGRAWDGRPVTSAERVYRDPGRVQGVQSIQIDRVITGPARTTVEWTLISLTEHWDLGWRAPVSSTVSDQTEVVDANVTSGPQIRPHGATTPPAKVSWMTAHINGRDAYECLCSTLGLWAGGLRHDGGAASVAGNYPALPPGTRSIDVLLPGVGTLSDIPVTAAADATSKVGPPVARRLETWIYDDENPPRDWTTADWPTPLPDPAQLSEYRASVEQIGALPDR